MIAVITVLVVTLVPEVQDLRDRALDRADSGCKPLPWPRLILDLGLILAMSSNFFLMLALVVVKLVEEVESLTIVPRRSLDLEVLVD